MIEMIWLDIAVIINFIMYEAEHIYLATFSGSLIGYATYNNSIVFVTPESINIINIHTVAETAAINGSSVLNFVINTRN